MIREITSHTVYVRVVIEIGRAELGKIRGT